MIVPSTIEIVSGLLIITGLSLVAVKVSALDIQGAVAGSLIGIVTLLAGGLGWLAIIVAFVLVSSVLTRYRFGYKQKLGSAQEKGGRRSWLNVLANGLVGAIAAIFELATHQEIYAVAFLGCIAAAMSDTIATEIGLLSASKPRLILDPRKIVVPGTSGGVSAMGEMAGLVSAIGLGSLGVALKVVSGTRLEIFYALVAVITAAFLAMNFDSLLGATVQGKNKCKICGADTENLYHHDEPTISEKGIRFLDNNAVNLIATVAAALISIALYLAFIS
ncbi:MAG TPA: DUF92 domain-containing protein [Nitrososphaerales archaeon]|nr:DUF92 domain-containing protein [Nitrososphaerales archaeon]